MSLRDIVAPFTVWKRALEKPYTDKKPLVTRPGAARYRGFHVNAVDKCIGCGTCESVCQNEAIDLVPVDSRRPRGTATPGLRPESGLRPVLLVRPVRGYLPDRQSGHEQRVRLGGQRPGGVSLRAR